MISGEYMVNDGSSWLMMVDNDVYIYITGWWLSPTPLKNMEVDWDDDIPS